MRYLELLFEGKTYTSESKIDQILDQNDFNWLIDAEIENSKLEIKKIHLSGTRAHFTLVTGITEYLKMVNFMAIGKMEYLKMDNF